MGRFISQSAVRMLRPEDKQCGNANKCRGQAKYKRNDFILILFYVFLY